jgi:hypothetical protein
MIHIIYMIYLEWCDTVYGTSFSQIVFVLRLKGNYYFELTWLRSQAAWLQNDKNRPKPEIDLGYFRYILKWKIELKFFEQNYVFMRL